MINSKIEWTDHTLNFWVGCRKVSEGCANCYMFRNMKGFGKDPTEIRRTSKATWRTVSKMKAGDKVFVCSWSDFFIEKADPWRDEAWEVMESRSDLIWIICTKRPENIHKYGFHHLGSFLVQIPGNVWLGFSAENQKWLNKRISCFYPYLVENTVKRPVVWISFEPLLGPVNIREYAEKGLIDWVVAGCESGPNRRPSDPFWFRMLRYQCEKYGIPFFLKQMEVNGKVVKMPHLDGNIWNEFPKIGEIEMPMRN